MGSRPLSRSHHGSLERQDHRSCSPLSGEEFEEWKGEIGNPCCRAKAKATTSDSLLQAAPVRLRLKVQQTSRQEGSQDGVRYTWENSEVTECMIVRERKLTGYRRHPLVGPVLYRVASVPVVVPADPGASERVEFLVPWGVIH